MFWIIPVIILVCSNNWVLLFFCCASFADHHWTGDIALSKQERRGDDQDSQKSKTIIWRNYSWDCKVKYSHLATIGLLRNDQLFFHIRQLIIIMATSLSCFSIIVVYVRSKY